MRASQMSLGKQSNCARRDVRRFHNASTGLAGRCSSGQSTRAVPLQKRLRGDGRCPARTGDLLLVRREQVLPSAAVCRSHRSASDESHLPAALYCGLSLPQRFHMIGRAFTRKQQRAAHQAAQRLWLVPTAPSRATRVGDSVRRDVLVEPEEVVRVVLALERL
jgi:hypothetical protein